MNTINSILLSWSKKLKFMIYDSIFFAARIKRIFVINWFEIVHTISWKLKYICIFTEWWKWKMYYTYGNWSRMEISCYLAIQAILFPCLLLCMFVASWISSYCHQIRIMKRNVCRFSRKSISDLLWLMNIFVVSEYDHFDKTWDYLFCIVNKQNGIIN